MSTTTPHTPGEFGEPPVRTAGPARGPGYYARKGLKALASLQLTVVLFALGVLLIFFGTLAQLDNGIWTVVDKYFWSWVVDIPFDLINKFLGVFWKERFPPGSTWAGTFPFPAGKLLGGLMLVNLLAAHATRFRLSWKRTGVFLIHGGLILLFVGEFITREYAVEQRMSIDEGKSVDFAEDTRHVELALVDKSNPDHDTVSVVPQNMLKDAKGRITHPDLPVDVEVVDFMANSAMEKLKPGAANPADSGIGKMWTASKRAEVSGVDPNQKVDMPAVYVKLYKKGTDQPVGTYLAALYAHLLGGDDEIEVDGKKIDVMLRFKRYYKPFRMYLDKFSFDKYTGTEKAKNYSSDVRIINADGTDGPQRRISMNEPLRYNGETFYQSSFDEKTEKTTILQVVKNPGWLLPYISCIVVGLGLVLHFTIYLVQFLRRGAVASAAATRAEALAVGAPDPWLVRYFPWIVLGVMAVYLLSVFGRMSPPKEPVDFDAFGRMVVHEGGRPKPLDTMARVHLRMISGREEVEDKNGKKVPAVRWYLETLSGGNPQQRGPVWDYQLVRIDNETVLRELGFENREGFRFSMNELGPKIDLIQKRMATIRRKVAEQKKLDTDENKFKELHDRMSTFMQLASYGGPLLLPPQGEKNWSSLHDFRTLARNEASLVAMTEAQKRVFASKKLDNLTPEDERNLVQRIEGIDIDKMKLDPAKRAEMVKESVRLLRVNPASIRDESRWEWILASVSLLPEPDRLAVADLYQKSMEQQLAKHPAAGAWEKLVAAHRDNKPAEFSAAVAEYRAAADPHVADTIPPKNFLERLVFAPFNVFGRNKVEITFNRFAPFYQCSGLYVLVFVLTVVGFTQQAAGRPHWATALRRSALLVVLLALAVHTVALLARMYLMERAGVFVTNLYSSAIFIGWGCVVVGLILEAIFHLGVGNLLAAALGLATCVVGHNLAADDTLEMMQAVLDTNFWLATHVTTITFGYTATFVAGALGSLYVVQVLAAVVRDSFQTKGEPTVGELLAFGVAATGTVAIPVFYLWFVATALDKFEVFPSFLLWTLFGVTLAAGVLYAIGLMLLRVSVEGVDAQGKPRAGNIPGLAQPLVAMALTPERGKVFGQMVYGVVCFATLLSFVGTVLGGIWADQSWGRFWGWDPKENGAVLIVLWNALILHARWAGLVKDRGVAVLAIFGNVITAWSWFGTNQLGLGLHAYGFDSRLADGCFNFWVSQMMILGLGLIPSRFWASATRRAAAASATAPASATATDAPLKPPTEAANGVPPAPPPNANGHPNGKSNGQPNGHPRRDKGKRHGKRR